jgi:hypothetical protein
MVHLGGAITFVSSARRRRGFYARLRAATIGKTLDRTGARVLWRRRNRADGGDMIRRRAALAAGLAALAPARSACPTCRTCRRRARPGSTSRASANAAGSACWRRAARRPTRSRISREAAQAAAEPDLKARLLGVAQIAQHQSPAEFGRQISEDRIFFADLIKTLDIKLE